MQPGTHHLHCAHSHLYCNTPLSPAHRPSSAQQKSPTATCEASLFSLSASITIIPRILENYSRNKKIFLSLVPYGLEGISSIHFAPPDIFQTRYPITTAEVNTASHDDSLFVQILLDCISQIVYRKHKSRDSNHICYLLHISAMTIII